MRTILITSMLLLATGCSGSNQYGSCVGLVDAKTPGVKYELSFYNIFLAALFSETVIVPVVVAAKMLECPTNSPKNTK